MNLWATKSIATLRAEANEAGEHQLKRALTPLTLVTLGIGAIIGAGIFVLTGHAAAEFAGPGVIISFAIAGLGCLFAGLCYSEYASMIPVAGSAYTYAYATMGEIFAWIIGWDLILEYAVSNMAVAVGFSAYFNDLLDNVFGYHLPFALSNPVFAGGVRTGAIFNLPGQKAELDMTHVDPQRFPNIVQALREAGLDPTRQRIPVAPASRLPTSDAQRAPSSGGGGAAHLA